MAEKSESPFRVKTQDSIRVHLVVGGFPPGNHAGHDMDFARLQLLQRLGEFGSVRTSVSGDFRDIDTYLPESRLLVTYVAGPYLEDEQNQKVREWLEQGGRWLALHGTSGGRHEPDPDRPGVRRMMKMPFHDTLGAHFSHHPPLRRVTVDVADAAHPLAQGLPASFDVLDEPYFVELMGEEPHQILLTTELPKDPTPVAWQQALSYDHTKSLQADGKSRVLSYTKNVGGGAVAYISLGHCHSPTTAMQPSVDESVDPQGISPPLFRGPWETDAYQTLLRNGIEWGINAG
jgi:type 1 glutamine amidotransferase